MGATFSFLTGIPDHRRRAAAMARLLRPLLCGALLGLICMTGEEGARAAVGTARGRGRGVQGR